jgi:hypothetical protein
MAKLSGLQQVLLYSFAFVGFSIPAVAADKDIPCPVADIENAVIIPTADLPCAANPSPSIAFTGGVYGGVSDGDEIAGLNASLFVPLTENFAIQADGDLGGLDGDVYGQGAMHALLMQSDFGAIGAYGSWSGYEGFEDVVRLGGEVYLNHEMISLAAVGGWQSEGKHNVFFDSKASFALTDATSVYAGYAYDDRSVGKVGFEHKFSFASDIGTALFVEGRFAKNEDMTALAGISFSFGGGSKNSDGAYCPTPGLSSSFRANNWSMATPKKNKPKETAVTETEEPDDTDGGTDGGGDGGTDGGTDGGGDGGTDGGDEPVVETTSRSCTAGDLNLTVGDVVQDGGGLPGQVCRISGATGNFSTTTTDGVVTSTDASQCTRSVQCTAGEPVVSGFGLSSRPCALTDTPRGESYTENGEQCVATSVSGDVELETTFYSDGSSTTSATGANTCMAQYSCTTIEDPFAP